MIGMNRRRWFTRALGATMAAALPGPMRGIAATSAAQTNKLADVGWVWDGHAIHGQWHPSIFGVGEGTKWFGLKKVCFMFHPNEIMAMEKLRDMEKIVCDISKWKTHRLETHGFSRLGMPEYAKKDGRISTKIEEAEKVGQLSLAYPNIVGGIDDDLLGIIKREAITPDQYARVHQALKRHNSTLKLWTVVYNRELNQEDWTGFEPCMDIINLCVGNEMTDFPNLDQYLDQCARIFPGKPVNLIYRLTDFRPPEPIPMTLLKSHWEDILRFVNDGRLSGYSILGGFMIDLYPEQSRWIRDFIAAN